MASKRENSHAQIVANFKQLINGCVGLGSLYNPPVPDLQIRELWVLHANAEEALKKVHNARADYHRATAERELTFKKVKPLAVRIISMLTLTKALTQTVDDARAIKRRLEGRRATPVAATNPDMVGAGARPVKRLSVSQQSYVMLAEHFADLLILVSNQPFYDPNEEDLKVRSLQAFLLELREKNNAVVRTSIVLFSARTARDRILFGKGTGLKDVAATIKSYTKSRLGSRSAQAKELLRIAVR